MDLPFDINKGWLRGLSGSEFEDWKNLLDQAFTRIEKLEEQNKQLTNFVLGQMKEEMGEIVRQIYQERCTDFYRAFFSGEYFFGNLQRAFGFWDATDHHSDAVKRFVMLYGPKFSNDISILRGNIQNYEESIDERCKTELNLYFGIGKKLDLERIGQQLKERRQKLEYEKSEPNNVLYASLWQKVEPLLKPVEDDNLESLLTIPTEVAINRISLLLESLRKILVDAGIFVCYQPSDLPDNLDPDDFFVETDMKAKERPLIVRLKDKYVYTKGFVYNGND